MLQKVITSDTYEAAYYKLNGAKMSHVGTRKVPVHRVRQAKINFEWVITMINVPEKCIEGWRDKLAIANAQELKAARLQLKKDIDTAFKRKY